MKTTKCEKRKYGNSSLIHCIKGTTKTAKCKVCKKTWINHYKDFGGTKTRKYCAEENCNNAISGGCHVQYTDKRYKKSWFIVPLCQTHNVGKEFKDGKGFSLENGCTLISVVHYSL